jgi:hypothetical protein
MKGIAASEGSFRALTLDNRLVSVRNFNHADAITSNLQRGLFMC